MVLQHIILLSGMGVMGYLLGIVASNETRKQVKRPKKVLQQKVDANAQNNKEHLLRQAFEDDDGTSDIVTDQEYDHIPSVRQPKGHSGKHNVQFRHTSTNHYVSQESFECQVTSGQRSKSTKPVAFQGVNSPQRTNTKSTRSGGSVGAGGRDPLVDTLFKEIELLIKEKANLYSEITNLRLKVEQLGELVTYLQIEREHSGNNPELEDSEVTHWHVREVSEMSQTNTDLFPIYQERSVTPRLSAPQMIE
eukprot:TRINITY_DN2494_c0_g1_i9.p2 TRINITY_DN2494_c0_g1~~TRINITY_DN2494_c0_g1_i9.p2  ORF type:complete len:249 (-),score=27.04 TRINITY_DN2494_c0_g1_i9:761-1507(-)